jgi:Heterokaryon incompatibility protein (HET)
VDENTEIAPSDKLREKVLGTLDSIRRKNKCAFCRLVARCADAPWEDPPPTRASDVETICFMRWVIDGQLSDKSESKVGSGYRARTRRIHIFSRPQSFKDAYLVLLAEDAPTPIFFGRKILQAEANFTMLKRWYTACEQYHGEECERALSPRVLDTETSTALRVVDVYHNCVIDVPSSCRYIALSYLWGGVSHFQITPDNKDQFTVPRSLDGAILPQTIIDAMELSRKLHEPYLWVDSLCLIHDVNGRNFEYNTADSIYANAVLTIVAGTGKDANAGLSGVRKNSRSLRQDIEECKPHTRLAITHLAEDYIRTSKWDTRAWTFQERLLSKRCLLFINSRIYFQCRQTTFCEDIVAEEKNVNWSLDSINMPSRVFKEPPIVQYTSAVQLYTQRQLTVESDILKAFRGVANVLKGHMNTDFFCGLPESIFDYALLWEPVHPLRRREGFSSWSWAGWVGEVEWQTTPPKSCIYWYKHKHIHDVVLPIRTISTMERPPDDMKSIATFNIDLPSSALDSSSGLLRFWTTVVQLRLAPPCNYKYVTFSPLARRLSFPSSVPSVSPVPPHPSLHRMGLSDALDGWCGTILLDSNFLMQEDGIYNFLVLSLAPDFTTQELHDWDQARIGAKAGVTERPVYNVLMIEWKGSIAYRLGLGRILAECVDRAFDRSWKEILMG